MPIRYFLIVVILGLFVTCNAQPFSSQAKLTSGQSITGVVINDGGETVYNSTLDSQTTAFVPFSVFGGTAEQYMLANSYDLNLFGSAQSRFVYFLTKGKSSKDPDNRGCVFMFYPKSDLSDYYVLSAPVGRGVRCHAELPQDTSGLSKQNVLIINVAS